jgi:23S rRNA (uracil1939-C5)-methyltransferase
VAAPVSKGEELDLRVDSLAYGGNGVARLDGFVVFVRGGLPGDRVRARVTKTKRGFAEAIAEEVLERSPERVEAPCRHFGVCGGCRFQDLAYESQLAAKEQQVRDALVRIGKFDDPPLEPIVPAVAQYGYRNKLEYSFTSSDDGVDLGFHRAGRWDEVIGIEECLLTTDLGNAVRLAVRDWAREEQLEPYDQDGGTGYLRHLVYREGRNTGQVLVLLVTAPGDRFEHGYLVDVLRRFPEVRSVHWAVNDTPAERTNLPTRLLWGEDAIEEEILGLRFRVRPGAFLQTNTQMAEHLYELAREYAGLTGRENVFDLYCGTGTIGLALAGSASEVWGVEISEESVACAIENDEYARRFESPVKVTSGCSSRTTASMSPAARAPMSAPATSLWVSSATGSGAEATARRARDANCRAAASLTPSTDAISPNGTPKPSCSTNATR